MKKFLNNLKQTAQENPLMALAAGAATLTAVAKLVEASGNRAGSRAYAKDVDRRIKNNKK